MPFALADLEVGRGLAISVGGRLVLCALVEVWRWLGERMGEGERRRGDGTYTDLSTSP
jgi:hypothetical protein